MNTQSIEERLLNIESFLLVQKNVFNLDEVCKFTGLSKSHIYKLTCNGGSIPHYKQAKHLYFDKGEVELWLKQNRVKTIDEIDVEASNYVTLKRGGAKC